MTGHFTTRDDSQTRMGGMIPGDAAIAAFSVRLPVPSEVPILIAVPHAGRAYPRSVVERMRNPGPASLRLEDRYADRVGTQIALATGAALVIAHAPRAMIDLNRAPDDVDWSMFSRGAPADIGSYTPGRRARTGLGLIPRRVPGLGELWKARHNHADLEERIAGIHVPYHAAVGEVLTALRDRWGAALLVDLHSMPPLGSRNGHSPPEFVVGDRFGVACDGRLVADAFSHFAQIGRRAAHNCPYAGGYVLERHAAPARGIHALQLEIDRSSYLDSTLTEPGAGFAGVVNALTGLVQRLAITTAELGQSRRGAGWVQAAE